MTGLLAASEHEVVAEAEGGSVLFQAFAGDDAGAELGQLAFAECGEEAVEVVGDDELQDRVTKEFEPLVVEVEGLALEREAGVGEGFGEEERIAKLIADAPLEGIHVRGEIRRGEFRRGRCRLHEAGLQPRTPWFSSTERGGFVPGKSRRTSGPLAPTLDGFTGGRGGGVPRCSWCGAGC